MSDMLQNIVDMIENDEIELDDSPVGGYTPYAIAKALNEVLKGFGVEPERFVAPQMLYQYSKNGRINGTKAEKGGAVRYTQDEVESFIAKFVARNFANEYRAFVATNTPDTEETETNEELVESEA